MAGAIERGNDESRPPWWDWEFEVHPHPIRDRSRGLSEPIIRAMLLDAHSWQTHSENPARAVLSANWDGALWHIIVEPNPATQTVLVITAYRVEKKT
ncbi:MAG: hypothetical protein HY719_12055 [Planctomycetes bacterium]|nr:hypothetical protein [Planctomycetota bacterium]